MKGKKILFVVPFVPYPLNTGARIRTNSFIESAFTGNELFLIFGDREGNGDNVPQIKQYFKKAWCVGFDRAQKPLLRRMIRRLRLMAGFVLLRSWQEQDYNRAMEKKILEVVKQEAIDVVFCRYISTAKYLFRLKDHINCKVIVDLDDIEPLKNEREINACQKRGSYAYIRFKLNNWMFARFFKKLSAVDTTLVCSEMDAAYVRGQKWTLRVDAIPNSIDAQKYASVGKLTRDVHAQKILMCCAHLGYNANVHGIVWFMEKVWSLIKAKEPAAEFYMVGRDPDPVLKGYIDNRNVHMAANVESVLPYYAKACATITPLFMGGGTRLKILESFAAHRPVISTTIGAEGLKVAHNKECLIADNPEEFAQACLQVLGDLELGKRLEEAGYGFLMNNFDLPVIKNRIVALFDEVTEKA